MENSSDDALFEIADDGPEPVVVKAPAGRSKVFRSYDRDQAFLMPPSLDDWLPQDHTARFIAETVMALTEMPQGCSSKFLTLGRV